MFESKLIDNIIPYKVSSHRAWELEHKNILKLDWNEATIPPSPKVNKVIIEILKSGKMNWYPNVNNESLRMKLAKYNSVSDRNIQYFASSDSLHEYVVRCFIEGSDKILVVAPTYDNFRAVAEGNGGKIIHHNLTNEFQLNYDNFEKQLKEQRPKMVYLVNPNNPTGISYDIKILESIIKRYENILFIIDEAYYEFCGKTLCHLTQSQENLIISRTFSKAFALASFRIGYVIAHPSIIQILNKLRNSKSISLMAQAAAEAVLDDLSYTEKYVKEVKETRRWFYNELKKHDFLTPFESDGNFIFLKFVDAKTKNKLIEYLEKTNIFIRDYGHIQTTSTCARITVGTLNQMNQVLRHINDFSAL